jgi:hypothetical protein
MPPILTSHAQVRAQQRGVPPLIQEWLVDYGESRYDGRGGVVRYFSKRARRALEKQVGSAPVRRLAEYLRCFLVESSDSGAIITVGKRYPNSKIYNC